MGGMIQHEKTGGSMTKHEEMEGIMWNLDKKRERRVAVGEKKRVLFSYSSVRE